MQYYFLGIAPSAKFKTTNLNEFELGLNTIRIMCKPISIGTTPGMYAIDTPASYECQLFQCTRESGVRQGNWSPPNGYRHTMQKPDRQLASFFLWICFFFCFISAVLNGSGSNINKRNEPDVRC